MNVSESSPGQAVLTERLLMRPIEPADVDAYHGRLFADPEVMRYLPGGVPLPRERLNGVVERTLDHWERYGYGVWAVFERISNELIGQCGLNRVEEEGTTEVLYAFARSSWGKGFATEAAGSAVRFGFERAGLDRIVAYAVPANAASIHVMEKLGMRPDGQTHLWGLDLVRFALPSSDWEPASP